MYDRERERGDTGHKRDRILAALHFTEETMFYVLE